MNDELLMQAAKEIGTPTFVFDIDELKNRIKGIRDILEESASGKIKLCYSIKANPFLIPYLIDEVDMLEVCSPGELEIVKSYNVPCGKIIYSGVNKGITDVSEAVRVGAGVITAESIRHFELIRQAAEESKKEISVILRLTSGNQFGMSIDDIRTILDGALYQNIDIAGIHYFAGTQRNNPKPQSKELQKIKDTLKELREDYDIPLEKLEYGPGLPFPYFEGDDFTDTLGPLRNISEVLSEMTREADLTIEMGRFLASSCGYYLTEIVDVKSSQGQNWCIIDGGLNHVNYYGQMMGMKRPVIKHFSMDNGSDKKDSENYALCGSLCTSNDILVRELPLQNPQIGDVLVLHNLGAYSVTEGINLFLSRDMARVAVLSAGKVSLLRDTVNSWRINRPNVI